MKVAVAVAAVVVEDTMTKTMIMKTGLSGMKITAISV
jgi:hypothetical protein